MRSKGNPNHKHTNAIKDNLLRHKVSGVFYGLTEEIPTLDKDSWFKD